MQEEGQEGESELTRRQAANVLRRGLDAEEKGDEEAALRHFDRVAGKKGEASKGTTSKKKRGG